MPSIEQHKNQYIHNKQLLGNSELNNDSNNDWLITIIFYCAVHLVELSFASGKYGFHNDGHQQRNLAVRGDVILKDIACEYLTLYNQSIRSRYKCQNLKKSDVKQAMEILQSIEDCLKSHNIAV